MKQQMLANLINYDNEAKSKLDLDVLAIINRGSKDKTMTLFICGLIFTVVNQQYFSQLDLP